MDDANAFQEYLQYWIEGIWWLQMSFYSC